MLCIDYFVILDYDLIWFIIYYEYLLLSLIMTHIFLSYLGFPTIWANAISLQNDHFPGFCSCCWVKSLVGWGDRKSDQNMGGTLPYLLYYKLTLLQIELLGGRSEYPDRGVSWLDQICRGNLHWICNQLQPPVNIITDLYIIIEIIDY